MELLDEVDLVKKVPAISAIVLAFAITTAVSVLTIQLRGSLEQSEIEHLQRESGLILHEIEAYNSTLEESTRQMCSIYFSSYSPTFSLQNDKTMPSGSVDAPVLLNGDNILNDDHSYMDHIHEVSGIVASVFVRKNNEFIRIATSTKNEKGERALGTSLNGHPANADLLAGKRWTGRVTLFGKEGMGSYVPLKDQQGNVIGVFGLAADFNQKFINLKERLKQIRIGKTGYVSVVDTRPGDATLGVMVVHPSDEGKNMLDVKSSDGQAIIQKVIQNKQGLLRYVELGKPNGASEAREMVAYYESFEPWHWVIMIGSYSDEFMALSTKFTTWIVTGSIIVMLGLTLTLFLVIRRFVARPLAELQNSIINLTKGNGDLRVRLPIKSHDEVSRVAITFNQFLDFLQEMIRHIVNSAHQVNEATQQLASLTHTVSDASDEQKNAATNTSAAVAQITDSITMVSNSAQALSSKAQASYEQTSSGNTELLSVFRELSDVGTSIQDVTYTVHTFVDNVASINDLTRQVSGLADQTNLLALNAAIEAARAGERGRGFAVVADEVRKLAEKSTQAAQKIDQVTSNLHNQSDIVNQAVKHGQERLETGLNNLRHVTDFLEQAGQITCSASEGISGISQAVNEQKQAVGEIAKQISIISDMTKHNAGDLHNANNIVIELHGLSATLRNHVGRFKIE